MNPKRKEDRGRAAGRGIDPRRGEGAATRRPAGPDEAGVPSGGAEPRRPELELIDLREGELRREAPARDERGSAAAVRRDGTVRGAEEPEFLEVIELRDDEPVSVAAPSVAAPRRRGADKAAPASRKGVPERSQAGSPQVGSSAGGGGPKAVPEAGRGSSVRAVRVGRSGDPETRSGSDGAAERSGPLRRPLRGGEQGRKRVPGSSEMPPRENLTKGTGGVQPQVAAGRKGPAARSSAAAPERAPRRSGERSRSGRPAAAQRSGLALWTGPVREWWTALAAWLGGGGSRGGDRPDVAGAAGNRRPGGGAAVLGGARSAGAPRKPRLNLPFDNRRADAGSWAYDHRIGLCVTLIAYLVLMIVFVSSKIVVGERPHQQGLYIDLQSLAQLEAERDRLEQELRQRQAAEEFDWKSVRNTVSNENELNEKLQDDRGTDAAALNDAAAEAEARMRANREAYEQGLAEEEAIRQRRGGDKAAGERRDRKVKGRVTVSFSLTDPVRQSVELNIPAYRCEGGGEVVVAITVDRSGEVVGARVVSGGDDCMREAALYAARVSTFNIDPQAPVRHRGTITYTFIPQ